ncbi:hypothetical protein [Pseudomonas sp. Leaf58]|uniref:hypothetical protein n=1 Tax=Pseudomonas sp. Leaf58 TaxID=1736226 RepID=UPI0006F97557|nr:hypothetical protein [Pseudomonas sp. Leaf58]KQN62433.1 hypothetical protein ASF02_09800 [Pseudomonas sp. Leaf58]
MNPQALVPSERFREAALANDALLFLERVEHAKAHMRQSIEDNRFDDLAAQHTILMDALRNIATVEDKHLGWGLRPPAFLLPLLPLLPKNDHMTFKHLGAHPEIDEHIFSHKLDIATLTFGQDEQGYRTLLRRLQALSNGSAYGAVTSHMARHLQNLEPTTAEFHRVARHLVHSIGMCPSGLKLSTEHHQLLETVLTTLKLPNITLTLDYAHGYQRLRMVRPLRHLIGMGCQIDVLNTHKRHHKDYRRLLNFIVSHLDEVDLVKLVQGLTWRGELSLANPLAHALFESNHLDTRTFIHRYTEHNARDEILFKIAKSYIDGQPAPPAGDGGKVGEYLNILIENSKHKNMRDLSRLSKLTQIPEDWIRATDWFQVHRLELDLGL